MKPLVAVAALVFVLGGCATAHPTPAGTPSSVTVSGTGLVFRVVTTDRFTTAVVLPQNDEVTPAQRAARARLRVFLYFVELRPLLPDEKSCTDLS